MRNNSELQVELCMKRVDELSCRTEIEQMWKVDLKERCWIIGRDHIL